jgi:hypothetical protein
MRQKVIVVGAGVAGLTAAHELIERDFDVHVVERRQSVGGKAASRRVAYEGEPGTSLPAEHGFRFFPGWYQHLPNTLSRIRTTGRRKYPDREPTVLDNLVTIDENMMHWSNRSSVPVPMHLPRSVGQAESLATLFVEMGRLDLAPAELAFFFLRLGQFLIMPEDQRRERLQKVTWWEYLEAEDKSRAFKDLISATTRTMVAAKATEASAYTICRLAIRTLADTLGDVDRVMDGPTSEKWLDVWRAQLERDGVKFYNGWELDDIVFSAKGERRIDKLAFSSVACANLGRLRRLLAPLAQDALEAVAWERRGEGGSSQAHALRKRLEANWTSFKALEAELHSSVPERQRSTWKPLFDLLVWLESVLGLGPKVLEHYEGFRRGGAHMLPEAPQKRRARVRGNAREIDRLSKLPDVVPESSVAEEGLKSFKVVVDELLEGWGEYAGGPQVFEDFQLVLAKVEALLDPQIVKRLEDQLRRAGHGFGDWNKPPDAADYFVMALPLEQMAYHVNRSVMMTTHDPSLERIVSLSSYTDWMAGIQFYLSEEADLGEGHMIFMDSEWALTAIEQVQFWRGVGGVPKAVKGIVSVDISAWDKRGRFVNKEAFNCSDEEIAREVWEELKASVRSERGQHMLHDGMLVGGKVLKRGTNFVLDDSIAELVDRRKQGAYERARSVRPSVTRAKPGDDAAVPYQYGPRLRFNVEPLMVNRVGSHALRPSAKTRIENMFLASDYVLTETDLACMEGANEAARRAVNALLDQARSTRERCELYEFSLPGGLLRQLTAFAQVSNPSEVLNSAGKMAGRAADTASKVVNQALGSMFSFWEKRR